MNLKADISALSDLKIVLKKLSFYIERQTLETLHQKYNMILRKYDYLRSQNEYVQLSAGQLAEADRLILQKQYGDAKAALQKGTEFMITALKAALEKRENGE